MKSRDQHTDIVQSDAYTFSKTNYQLLLCHYYKTID